MKTSFLLRLPFIPVIALTAMFFCSCASDESTDYKKFRDEVKREDALTDKVMEEDLDDELNPTERAAIHPIFENNAKARERMVDDTFQDQPKDPPKK